MKRLLALVASLLVFISSHAEPLSGSLKVAGGYLTSSAALTGDIGVAANTLSFDSSAIHGQSAVFVVSELLGTGSHTRSYTTGSGTTLTRTETIPAGTVGAYMVIQTYGTWYQVFNAWTVSPDGTTYATVDIPGNVLVGGPLNGRRVRTDFVILPPPAPTMSLSIDVAGGAVQECTSPDGATVAVAANVTLSGHATLDRVDWYVGNIYMGSGTSLDLTLPVGTHAVHAVGTATDGVTTGSADLDVQVQDTTAPDIEIQFLNSQGQPVTSASMGGYSVHFVVSDACDAAPVVTAAAKPVMDVSEGDVITINSTSDVHLPTTAVEVTATARDVNGRAGMASATLTIH